METTTRPQPLQNSLDAFRHFYSHFNWDQEEVHVVAMSAGRIPIATRLLFRGTVDFCLFHPRDIFRFLVQVNASSFIIAHNHPSGDKNPSYPDIVITKKLHQAAKLMQIELVDHLVMTPEGYSSFKEFGLLGKNRRRTQVNSFSDRRQSHPHEKD